VNVRTEISSSSSQFVLPHDYLDPKSVLHLDPHFAKRRKKRGKMSDVSPYPEPPSRKRNDVAIELISGSVGGASQVLIGQVSERMLDY